LPRSAINHHDDELHRGALGFGAMGLTGTYGAITRSDARRVLDRVLDIGISHIDTAASYGDGDNERLVGEAIAGRRDGVFVATKCGVRWRGGRLLRDGAPTAITAGVEMSLSRLGIDAVDLVYLHRVDPDVPIEESIGALSRLRDKGLVRRIGVSEASVPMIRRAFSVAPIAALQSEYSLMTRDVEQGTIGVLRELDITLVAYSPLARGLLGGSAAKLDEIGRGDFRQTVPRFRGDHLRANLARAAALGDVARACGAHPAQVALAWLMAQHHPVVPIPGTTRLDALEQNARARELRLTREQMAQLSRAFPLGAAAGQRGPE